MRNKKVIAGIVVLLILILHPLPRNIIRCGGLPVFASDFAASYSYVTPKSGFVYLQTSLLPIFDRTYCSEAEAKKAGYSPGGMETKTTSSEPSIDFTWYLPGDVEKTYPYYWLTYTEGEFHAILTDQPIEGKDAKAPKWRLDEYIVKPTDYNPPSHCGSFAPIRNSSPNPERERCVLVTKTPGGHEVYQGTDWEDTYYTIHDGLLVYLTFKDDFKGSRVPTVTKMVDGLRPLAETERKNVEVRKNFNEEPK